MVFLKIVQSKRAFTVRIQAIQAYVVKNLVKFVLMSQPVPVVPLETICEHQR